VTVPSAAAIRRAMSMASGARGSSAPFALPRGPLAARSASRVMLAEPVAMTVSMSVTRASASYQA